MSDSPAPAREFWRQLAGRLGLRRDNAPIDSVATLQRFVATRAAFVAQKTLYGYLKTRMGTRYPSMFEDDVFVHSINIAKWHVFAACLSDLAIYAVAHATRTRQVGDDVRRDLALGCFRRALAGNASQMVDGFDPQAAEAEFADALQRVDWGFGALRPESFASSPRALVRWAPIAPELKRHDTEIVENSIRFAWRDIRAQLLRRLDAEAIAGELAAPGAPA